LQPGSLIQVFALLLARRSPTRKPLSHVAWLSMPGFAHF
jgi:hypothetical protein